MSAFTDIWLGNTKPVKHRKNNSEWTHINGYWLSNPVSNVKWSKEIETSTHSMIVLGQFYEAVDMNVLLANCIAYANGTSTYYNDPAGHYIIFISENQSGNKYVFTNRFGTYHAYWSGDENVKAISTYYIGMAQQAINKQLDWEGITGFMAMGYFPADKTYLQSIHIIPPSCCYIFNSACDLINRKCYWNWTFDAIDSSDINIRLKDRLTAGIKYATDGCRVAVPLSGGLDSRMLGGIFSDVKNDTGKHAWAFTYGYAANSPEIKIGKKISNVIGLPSVEKIVPNYLFAKMDDIINSVELFQYVDGTRQACMLTELEHGADVVLCGHWGDVWMDDVHIENAPTETQLNNYFRKKIIKKGSAWLLDNICKPYIKQPIEYLDSYFSESVRRYEHLQETGKIIKAYKTDQWSFRWTTASIRMYQAEAMPVLPFYDKYVVDLLMNIPPAQLSGRSYQVSFIKKNLPSLAAITWQEYDANLYNYKYLNNRNYLYRAVHKVKRIIGGEPVTRNWEIFYLDEEGKKNLKAALNIPALNELTSRNDIEVLLEGFYKTPTASTGYTISMLHTFSQFLKVLYANE